MFILTSALKFEGDVLHTNNDSPEAEDISTLKHIPTRGYSEYINYMNTTFKKTFGSENYYQLNTSHGNVPNMAMNIDENNDNKSDLVEWMLTR